MRQTRCAVCGKPLGEPPAQSIDGGLCFVIIDGVMIHELCNAVEIPPEPPRAITAPSEKRD